MAYQSERILTTTADDGTVVLNVDTGIFATLNSTGGQVWQALLRGDTLDVISLRIARETNAPLEAVRFDVEQFVQSLKTSKLLEA